MVSRTVAKPARVSTRTYEDLDAGICHLCCFSVECGWGDNMQGIGGSSSNCSHHPCRSIAFVNHVGWFHFKMETSMVDPCLFWIFKESSYSVTNLMLLQPWTFCNATLWQAWLPTTSIMAVVCKTQKLTSTLSLSRTFTPKLFKTWQLNVDKVCPRQEVLSDVCACARMYSCTLLWYYIPMLAQRVIKLHEYHQTEAQWFPSPGGKTSWASLLSEA